MDSEIKGVVNWEYLGVVSYSDGLALQKERRERLRAGGSDAGGFLLLLQHRPVITDGRFGRGGNIILTPEAIERRGVEVYKTERGGDVTFHGPGQFVAYPIIDLRAFDLGAKSYVRALEETIILVLKDFGMHGVSMGGYPGVWAYGGKIASIGVSVSGGVTMHGCAINVNNDLGYFSMIIPCGLEGVIITSMKVILDEEIDFGAVTQSFIRRFGEVFKAEMRSAA
ncbi:MAG: lipoyl(octanoyl) transferase LipB [Thermodesulfobacteriota bacterium]